MTSINHNSSAQIALRTLSQTTKNIDTVQQQITTGKKVNSAKDNASAWAISKTMESDLSSLNVVQDNLAFGSSAVSIARQGAESVNELLGQIKERVVSAQGAGVDRTKLADEVTELANQITSVLDTAQFNGENLLKSSTTMSITSSISRDASGSLSTSKIDVDGLDLSTTLAGLASLDISSSANAATALGDIETMMKAVVSGASTLGATEKRMESQSDFLKGLSDGIEAGISALVDTDMEEAAARLQAAQTQQQLGVQMLANANGQPAQLLNLFR